MMRGKHKSVLSRLLSVLPQLYSLHCTCHVANLCAEAACEAFLPSGLQDWLMKVAKFFDNSTKRTVGLKKMQERSGTKQHKLVKPASTRWLSLQQCISRTLEQ